MPSRVKAAALALLIGPWTPVAPAAHAAASGPPASAAISPEAMDAAIAALRRDPNLGGQTRIRTLRWTTRSQPGPPPTAPRWMSGLFDLAGQFAGLLLWTAGAAAAAMAAVWIVRLLRSRGTPPAAAQADPVGDRVQGLDLRPDSLPDDVGAAALALLHAGRLRESLSLLYRASLSSAVHRFGAAVGAHHTEREVLGAVGDSLDERRARYFADLVSIRQRVVYAGETMPAEAILPLCTGFSSCFDPPPP